jgi:hypothetical protein
MNAVSIPEIRVGEPTRCGALAAYALYPEHTLFPEDALDYVLSDEAQEAGMCAVREVSEEGKVGELLVENVGERPVLFLEGEELVGAKQNRVLLFSVLVGAGSRVSVPVFCVERGRWDRSSGSLKTGSHSPPSLRFLLKGGSDRPGIFRRADRQVSVWRFIVAKHRAAGTRSPRGNLSDAIRSSPEVVKELRRDLQYPEGASGIAVAIDGRTVGIDLFDQPDSLRQVWDRLVVLGLTFEALDLRDVEPQGDRDEKPVRLYRESLKGMRWQEAATVGLGTAYRGVGGDGSLATALVVDGTLLHLSLSIPVQKQGEPRWA